MSKTDSSSCPSRQTNYILNVNKGFQCSDMIELTGNRKEKWEILLNHGWWCCHNKSGDMVYFPPWVSGVCAANEYVSIPSPPHFFPNLDYFDSQELVEKHVQEIGNNREKKCATSRKGKKSKSKSNFLKNKIPKIQNCSEIAISLDENFTLDWEQLIKNGITLDSSPKDLWEALEMLGWFRNTDNRMTSSRITRQFVHMKDVKEYVDQQLKCRNGIDISGSSVLPNKCLGDNMSQGALDRVGLERNCVIADDETQAMSEDCAHEISALENEADEISCAANLRELHSETRRCQEEDSNESNGKVQVAADKADMIGIEASSQDNELNIEKNDNEPSATPECPVTAATSSSAVARSSTPKPHVHTYTPLRDMPIGSSISSWTTNLKSTTVSAFTACTGGCGGKPVCPGKPSKKPVNSIIQNPGKRSSDDHSRVRVNHPSVSIPNVFKPGSQVGVMNNHHSSVVSCSTTSAARPRQPLIRPINSTISAPTSRNVSPTPPARSFQPSTSSISSNSTSRNVSPMPPAKSESPSIRKLQSRPTQLHIPKPSSHLSRASTPVINICSNDPMQVTSKSNIDQSKTPPTVQTISNDRTAICEVVAKLSDCANYLHTDTILSANNLFASKDTPCANKEQGSNNLVFASTTTAHKLDEAEHSTTRTFASASNSDKLPDNGIMNSPVISLTDRVHYHSLSHVASAPTSRNLSPIPVSSNSSASRKPQGRPRQSPTALGTSTVRNNPIQSIQCSSYVSGKMTTGSPTVPVASESNPVDKVHISDLKFPIPIVEKLCHSEHCPSKTIAATCKVEALADASRNTCENLEIVHVESSIADQSICSENNPTECTQFVEVLPEISFSLSLISAPLRISVDMPKEISSTAVDAILELSPSSDAIKTSRKRLVSDSRPSDEEIASIISTVRSPRTKLESTHASTPKCENSSCQPDEIVNTSRNPNKKRPINHKNPVIDTSITCNSSKSRCFEKSTAVVQSKSDSTRQAQTRMIADENSAILQSKKTIAKSTSKDVSNLSKRQLFEQSLDDSTPPAEVESVRPSLTPSELTIRQLLKQSLEQCSPGYDNCNAAVGREKQTQQIFEVIRDSIDNCQGTAVFVCGGPGQGKTMVASIVLGKLEKHFRSKSSETATLPYVLAKFVGSTVGAGSMYSDIAHQLNLCDHAVANIEARNMLLDTFTFKTTGKRRNNAPMIILFIDEIDMCKEEDARTLMEATSGNSRFILIGMANHIAYAHGLNLSFSPTILTFESYEQNFIVNILENRTNGLFEDRAIKMLAMKIIHSKGSDVRALLEMAQQCLLDSELKHKDIDWNSPRNGRVLVDMNMVNNVCKSNGMGMDRTPARVAGLVLSARFLLVSMLVADVGTIQYANVKDILAAYERITQPMGTSAPRLNGEKWLTCWRTLSNVVAWLLVGAKRVLDLGHIVLNIAPLKYRVQGCTVASLQQTPHLESSLTRVISNYLEAHKIALSSSIAAGLDI